MPCHSSCLRTLRSALTCLLIPLASLSFVSAQSSPVFTWGDQGDGTFRNPVLNADYSDPDAIRVGDDFFLIASEFHFMGMQVLHSRDLVNWRIIAQVYRRLPISPKYDEMRGYAEGTWAPTLRYHDGTYYIFVCTPHDGLFMWHAKDPAGPWSDVVTVKSVDGWEDPCPFWDDDGNAYLMHSRLRAGPLIVHKMSPDGTRLLDDGVEVYRGNVAEGPKIFKRRGWYYVSLPEGGVSKGGQVLLRAKSLYGPFERRQVLVDGSPHQGALLEVNDTESWFIGFKSTDQLGRVCHLIPVRWGDDDWPVFGDNGTTVAQSRKPSLPPTPRGLPQMSDDFSKPTLGLQWQWNHNPVDTAWSLTEHSGWLRLRGQPAAGFKAARNTLTQKLWGTTGTFEAALDASSLAPGQRAGVTFMSGDAFGWIGIVNKDGRLRVATEAVEGPELQARTIRLRAEYRGAEGTLSYSLDGKIFVELGGKISLRAGHWKGARVALFCFGEGSGFADIDAVDYRCDDVAAKRD